MRVMAAQCSFRDVAGLGGRLTLVRYSSRSSHGHPTLTPDDCLDFRVKFIRTNVWQGRGVPGGNIGFLALQGGN